MHEIPGFKRDFVWHASSNCPVMLKIKSFGAPTFVFIAMSFSSLAAHAEDSGWEPGLTTTVAAHGKEKTPETLVGVGAHMAGKVVNTAAPVSAQNLALAADASLQLSIGASAAPKPKVTLDGDFQLRTNMSVLDDLQTGRKVRGVLGVAPMMMGRGHGEFHTDKPHDKDTSFFEALVMGTAGIQFATDNCRVLMAAQAGGGLGTIGDSGWRAAMGSSLYVNCRKYFDASLSHERISARRSADGGPYITDVVTADARANFITDRSYRRTSAPWSVGIRAQGILPHEQGGSGFNAGELNRDGIDARVQLVAGKAF
jgi:hypothetical protein